MENPFQRRATEFLRDDEAFLAIVSPEPVTYFLGKPGKDGRLYDRLVLLRGTPGSGKTTLARLFEFPTLSTLLRNQSFAGHKDLNAALSACGAIEDQRPKVLGCRLPLETDYRDFWEFPYSDELKANLMTALLQARTVLGWFRHLRAAGIAGEKVQLLTRPEFQGLLDTIGGTAGEPVRARAAKVENSIYRVMTALVAPPETQLPAEALTPYRPFDIIDQIRIPGEPLGIAGELDLLPLGIFDDAHVLHPSQFNALERFLVRRELRVARWIIARFDILLPQDALAAATDDPSDGADFPGVSAQRDTTVILLQSSGNRRTERTRFRNMAKDMATRYLRRMPLLYERGLTVLGNLLGDSDVTITPGRLKDLRDKIDSAQRKLNISDAQRKALQEQIDAFWKKVIPLSEDVVLRMLLVMMHRYDIRRRRGTSPSLFGDEDEPDAEVVVAANDAVYEAALFQLFRDCDRPYFYGIDDVCDASSENAEQFLQLAAVLVEAVATQIARNKSATLLPPTQHNLLRERGARIIEYWNFPHDDMVRRLVKKIAESCLEKSLEPNGAVIANAFGIRQEEFDSLAKTLPDLARVLQFAVAYNAITLVPHHSCKSKEWCLLELGGMALLKYGLTLKRGGFIEGTAADIAGFIEESEP
jgi:predicted kinase